MTLSLTPRTTLRVIILLCACSFRAEGAPLLAKQIEWCQLHLPPLQSRLGCAPN